MKALATVVAALLFATPLAARPIAYPGGGMLMLETALDNWSGDITYTPSPRYSVGVRTEYDEAQDRQFVGPTVNYLAYRNNAPDSQANVYLMASAGAARGDLESGGRATRAATSVGLEADWENRRLMVVGEVRGFAAEGMDKSISYRGRVGVAPYVGEYGDLHTWLILQVDHRPDDRDPVTLTPVIRLFKGSALVEVGSSLKGDAFATLWLYF